MWYCVLTHDLRFVYCGEDRRAAEAAHAEGSFLAEGANYGEALTKAAIGAGQLRSPPRAKPPADHGE
jgi:hypothetical protein